MELTIKKEYYLNACLFDNPVRFKNLNLIQIGRLQCGSGDFGIPLHIHSDGLFELTVVNSGSGSILTNNVQSSVKKGDLYFSFPCDTHVVNSSPEQPINYDFLAFTVNDENFKKELETISQYYSPKERRFCDQTLTTLCNLAVEEFKSPSMFSNELLENMLNQILVLLLRNFQTKQKQSENNAISKKDVYNQIRNYINTHLYSLKNLTVLADVLKYNYSYLSTIFKEISGETILDYYQKRRLNAAQHLIMENKFKLHEIASMLNYSSPCSFSRAFKELYNISPKQYQKNLW
jgi:AraC-like DNA-binding protein